MGYATNPDFSRLSVVELKYPSEGNSIVRGGQLTDFPGVGLGEESPVQRTFIKARRS